MNKVVGIVYLAFSLITLSCSTNSDIQKGEVLTKSIEYAVEIGSPIELGNDKNKLNPLLRKEFLQGILNKAKNQQLPVYYFMDDTLIPMEKEYLNYLFHHVDTEYVMGENNEYQKIIFEENLDLDAIVKLKFKEQWYFNAKTNQFTKKVIAICPMVEKFKDANESLGFKGLFWIYLENK